MVNFFTRLLRKIFGRFARKHSMRILMTGLDASGKTTILYKLKIDEVVNTVPTIGFNMETFTYKKIVFNVWDLGGQDKIRPLWKHYYQNTNGLIFVVDSVDRERINDARNELQSMLREEELSDVVLLVFANKQDLTNSMSVDEVTSKMALHGLRHRVWHVQPSCAISGDGLLEGLDWFCQALKAKKKEKHYH